MDGFLVGNLEEGIVVGFCVGKREGGIIVVIVGNGMDELADGFCIPSLVGGRVDFVPISGVPVLSRVEGLNVGNFVVLIKIFFSSERTVATIFFSTSF